MGGGVGFRAPKCHGRRAPQILRADSNHSDPQQHTTSTCTATQTRNANKPFLADLAAQKGL